MSTVNAAPAGKTIADAVAEYDTLKPIWERSRAIISGERYAKDFDVGPMIGRNLLIPFSPSMTLIQYQFYKAEAELPGIVSQFVKMIVGGLLRKQPVLSIENKSVPKEAENWILNEFGQDGSPITSFLDEALYEELQTSRAWVYIDHPVVAEDASPEEKDAAKPYPILWKAESVINWRTRSGVNGKAILDRVLVRGYEERYDEEDNEFHPSFVDTIRVHELVNGKYQVRIFQAENPTSNVPTIAGQKKAPSGKQTFVLIKTLDSITVRGERLTEIPAWPLNGQINPIEPMMSSFVDKEVALYNKFSRRNHLLYGAATYTPVISDDMSDDKFQAIVDGGLGTWIKLSEKGKSDILKAPTEALQDYDRAIAAAIEEMARMGMRMLSPETDQSGIALDIRNAAQNAQLGTLNTKVSNTMRSFIVFMLRWRYDVDLTIDEVKFQLSADFNPTPLGADWLRLATEWYEKGLIPRSVWIEMLKQNDMIPPDYDDEEGQKEITEGMETLMGKTNEEHAQQLEGQMQLNEQNAKLNPKPKPGAK